MKSTRNWPSYWPFIILLVLVAGAFLLRVAGQWDEVFTPAGVMFRAVDPWLHMRMADEMVASGSLAPPYWDMLAAYPAGTQAGFYPLTQWAIAAPSILFGLDHETVGALLPPILGALILVPVYFLGKVVFNSRGVGLLAALLVAVLPGELLHRSLLGFVDQHIMESFLMVWVILFLVLARKYYKWGWIVAAGVALGLYCLNWHGAAFLLMIIAIWFVAEFLIRYYKREPTLPLCHIVAGAAGLALVMSAWYLRTGLDGQKSLAALLLLIAAPYALHLFSQLVSRRVFFGVLAIGGCAAVTFLCVPMTPIDQYTPFWGLRQMGLGSIFWGAGSIIQEANPTSLNVAFAVYGMSFFLFFGGMWFVFRNRISPLFVVWALVLFLAMLGQRRWGYYFTLPLALATAYFIFEAARLFKPNLRAAVVGIICLFMVIPSMQNIKGIAALPNNINPEWYYTCLWVEENTPEPALTEASPQGWNWGILSWWDYGHWIARIGGRPPLTSPANQAHWQESWFLVSQSEGEANSYLEGLDIRYVIIDEDVLLGKWYAVVQKTGQQWGGVGEADRLRLGSMAHRLWVEEAETWVKVAQFGRVKVFEGKNFTSEFPHTFISDARYQDIGYESVGTAHVQGVCTDGTYLWYSSNSRIRRTLLAEPDWESPLATNDHADVGLEESWPINGGISVYGGFVYATATKHYHEPYRCWVRWYDKMTLEFAGEVEIYWPGSDEAGAQEGAVFHDGFWWVCYFDLPVISRYDADWNWVDDFSLTSYHAQGMTWVGDDLWISVNQDNLLVYHWDGSSLSYCGNVPRYTGAGYTQGIAKELDSDVLWWAEFTEDEEGTHNNLVRTLVE